ncbi:MAG: hypothetical protein AAF682_14995 [Planctomycetota bacterium]
MSHRVAALLPLTVLSLAFPLWGDVLVVDEEGAAGTFPGIKGAVFAASEGDTILVRSGTYPGFTVDGKSLTIVAEDGAEVAVLPEFSVVEHAVQVRGLGPGQHVVVRGMTLFPDVLSFPEPVLLIEDNLGTVVLEDVHTDTFESWQAVPLSVRNSQAVLFNRCTFQASICGFPCAAGEVSDSNLTVYDSEFRGGDGTTPLPFSGAGAGGAGLIVSGGTLFAAGTLFAGGDGGTTENPEQCTAAGGDGIQLTTLSPALTLRGCTLAAGQPGGGGTSDPPCGDPNGEPIHVETGTVLELPGEARSLAVSAAVREGESLALDFGGEPGDLVFVGFAHTIAPPLFVPVLAGELALGFPFQVLFQGEIGASGALATAALMPELGPGVMAVHLHLQAVHFALGGATFLGGTSSAVGLDASL